MTDQPRTGVLIVDDHPLFRDGLAARLSADPSMEVLGTAGSGAEALALFDLHHPALIFMDLRMPGMDGLATIKAIMAKAPNTRIIVVSSSTGDADIHAALAAGARGYLLKDVGGDEIMRAIEAVRSGKRYLPPEVAQKLAEGMPTNDLTDREHQVLELMVRGKANKEIAVSLGIEESTVKVHARSIFSKLGVSQRTEAVVTALKRGLVHLS
jgi:two-component system, NarL family, response regulator